ncbi:NERD domain-containing protein [Bacillus benzoevorans]|uniref:Superfamily II DNA helicase RecQ n=1 Tax=Bacillus benzoevorans TaxID=1456 RepID=A0A7X0HTS9_9BACI|nr:NERD domain-containing protein [Bacillus benzoevorans]MBB6446730.1 superfamily II DNA helicase RecQ [Bacillus benzoevorans]
MEYKQVGFFKRVANALTDIEKLKTPILVKEAAESIQLIEQYKKKLEHTADEKQNKFLNNKIKLLELGLKGENRVLFELQNSFLPIHILHDVRIAHKDLKAQIDFVVLTRKFMLVIEVKNYFGNILVNEKDEFIRQVYKGNKLAFQEGFYSPIRQAERQVEVFESYMRDMGAVTRTPIKSVVVFSNNRTIINTKKASEQVKKKILRADGLVGYIKQELEKASPVHFLDNRMKEISDYIKASHFEFIDDETDSVEMKLLEETISTQNESNELMISVQTNNTDLEETLKRFRMKLATEQNVKAFHIFSNRTLEELILKQPCNLNDLQTIHGIGETKINAFGEELIGIIKNYQHR